MKRLLVIAAACLFAILPSLLVAAPADSTSATEGRPNSLQKGAKAIQFLSSDWFRSGNIYFKTHRAAGHALRLGLSFSADAGEGDMSTDTTSVAVEKGFVEDDGYAVGVELIMQRYANVFASAHVFYGIGPFFSIGSSHQERQRTDLGSGDTLLNRRDYDSWTVGGLVVLGAEWFISRALSLDMEYYVSGGYRSSTWEYWDQYVPPYPDLHSTEERHEVFVSGGSARIGLGIYF